MANSIDEYIFTAELRICPTLEHVMSAKGDFTLSEVTAIEYPIQVPSF